MKYCKSVIVALVLLLTLCGCSVADVITSSSVETLEGWSFQYNEGTKDYSLFFALVDGNGKNVSTSATVNIKIVNSADEVVFENTKSITKDDFGYYSNQTQGERFLANIRIPEAEITPGKATDGTVYFTVYKDDVFRFDECNCKVLYNLPTKDFDITVENLPIEIKVKSYNGSVQSKLNISSVTYEVSEGVMPMLKVIISGEKTYGNGNSMYDMFNYKLYDSEGYMVKSGSVFLDNINSGDKFKDDSLMLYDITPGETYTLKFYDYQ